MDAHVLGMQEWAQRQRGRDKATHVGQLTSACIACARCSGDCGCAVTADWLPTREKEAGAIHLQVSQSAGAGEQGEGREQ